MLRSVSHCDILQYEKLRTDELQAASRATGQGEGHRRREARTVRSLGGSDAGDGDDAERTVGP